MEPRPAPVDLLAANVRAELARRGITRRQLARDLGWPNSTLHRRLTGVTPFAVPELLAVARYLNVPLSLLLGEEQGTAA